MHSGRVSAFHIRKVNQPLSNAGHRFSRRRSRNNLLLNERGRRTFLGEKRPVFAAVRHISFFPVLTVASSHNDRSLFFIAFVPSLDAGHKFPGTRSYRHVSIASRSLILSSHLLRCCRGRRCCSPSGKLVPSV